MFKTLLLFGLAFISTATTAGDKNKSYYPTKGYRGSFDLAWADNFNKDRTYYSPQFSTTHGYQIMPELYAGVGALFDVRGVAFGSRMEHRAADWGISSISPFATVRYDFCQKKVSPYVEGRIGYRMFSTNNDSEGDDKLEFDKLYAVPMVGVRLNHFNVAVSYEWITVGDEIYGESRYYMTKRFSALGIHAGFDFGARKKQ